MFVKTERDKFTSPVILEFRHIKDMTRSKCWGSNETGLVEIWVYNDRKNWLLSLNSILNYKMATWCPLMFERFVFSAIQKMTKWPGTLAMCKLSQLEIQIQDTTGLSFSRHMITSYQPNHNWWRNLGIQFGYFDYTVNTVIQQSTNNRSGQCPTCKVRYKRWEWHASCKEVQSHVKEGQVNKNQKKMALRWEK